MEVKISTEVAQALLRYLVTKPWQEANDLIVVLGKAVNDATAAAKATEPSDSAGL